jgi:predicted TIM-barrel fold metal-dependent hydrolase
VGVQLRHLIGVDHVMWSSDFPHTETDWPNSRRTIEVSFKDVPDHERHRMLAQNAVEFFHLDAA